MNTLFTGQTIIRLSTVDSTNNYAATMLSVPNWADGTVIVADHQTGGRGRHERSWDSAPGKNLTCSYLFKPHFLSPRYTFMLNMVAALAVYDLLSHRYASTTLAIKWPNDLLYGERKICGILAESHIRGQRVQAAVIGLGININQATFAHPRATSLNLLTGKSFDLHELLGELSSFLEARYLMLKNNPSALTGEYNRRLFGLQNDRPLILRGHSTNGRLLSVRNDGMAIFHTPEGQVECGIDDVDWCWDQA
jgi:BirA family biotin operon repressor/biotin-[acetyl-CoA-carboxylase] ligase